MLACRNDDWGKSLYWKTVSYYSRHREYFWGNLYDDARFGMMQTLLDIPSGQYVLNFGCGAGVCEQFIPKNINVAGIDNNIGALKVAKEENPCAAYILGDCRRLPFKEKSFNQVIILSVIEAMRPEYRPQAIEEIWRVMKQGGGALTMVSNGDNPDFIKSPSRMNEESLNKLIDPTKFAPKKVEIRKDHKNRWIIKMLKKR